MAQQRAATTYTTAKVLRILASLPQLPEPSAASSDIRTKRSAAGMQGNALENRMVERADVEWALSRLPKADNTYRCVYLCHVGGATLMEVAELIGCSYETVRRRRTAGIKEMVRLLNEGRNQSWEVCTTEGIERL